MIGIHVIPDQMMTYGGSTEPCAMCTLNSIGKIGVEENKEHTKVLTEKISSELGVPARR